jgi:hypothetical protein
MRVRRLSISVITFAALSTPAHKVIHFAMVSGKGGSGTRLVFFFSACSLHSIVCVYGAEVCKFVSGIMGV